MYTQCPDCGTVFRVTADALRVAQGDVRCGICSTRFNALESLRDEPRDLLAEEPSEDTITVEELPGNEMIELSSPEAESETVSEPEVPAGEGPGPAGDEHRDTLPVQDAGEPTGEDEPSDEAASEALEFHGSAEDLERVFMLTGAEHGAGHGERRRSPEPDDEAEDEQLSEAFERASLADLSGIEVHEERVDVEADTAPEDPEPTDEFLAVLLDEAGSREEPRAGEAPVARPADDASSPVVEPRFLIPEELRRDLAANEATQGEGSLGLEPRESFGLPPPELEEGQARRWPWAVGATLLVVALAAQAVHFWRDELAQHPLAGPWVLRAYQSLSLPLDPPADLAALELRQWGATSDPALPDRLRLRASIVNRAAFAQPYPLLRLSLQDRFGNTIGVRDVGAEDYLPGGAASTAQLLGPGQRADAEIVFVDPGRDAVGYELDLCLPAGDGVRCANPAGASR